MKLTSSSSQLVKLIFSENEAGDSILIPKSSLSRCQWLDMRCNFSAQHNCNVIPLETDSQAIQLKLTRQEMQRIAPYFWTNAIGPDFRDKKTYPHTFGRIGETLKSEHAEQLGMAFVTACKISHEELQEHILEKLQALHPLPDVSLLDMIVMCYSLPPLKTAAEIQLGSWIVDHVAESYPKLMKNNSEILIRLFSDNTQLEAAVMQRLEESAREEKSGCQDEAVHAKQSKVKKFPNRIGR